MSPRRALAAGAVVAGALVVATLVSALRPDAESEIQAARTAEDVSITKALDGPAILSRERGRSAYVSRFGPDLHGGHRQSWDIAQAPNGLVYVANSDGVLEHDGTDWRLIEVPGFRARAIALSPSGVVHVGGEGTAGVLAVDSTGQAAYREVVGTDVLDGEEVWGAVSYDSGNGGGVLFQTFDRLVAVERGAVVDLHRAPDGDRYHKVFEAGGEAYVRLEGVGLLRYNDRRLVPVRGGERFADMPLRALFHLGAGPSGVLLGVTDDELFRIDPAAATPVVPVPTAATAVLRRTRAYHGCLIGPPLNEGGALAITTVGGGVIVLRPDGRIVERLGEAVGLTSNDLVLGCAADSQDGLWLALSEAVLRVDTAAPLTLFGADLGLHGSVYNVVRMGGDVYAGTSRGIYRLRPSTDGEPATFEPVRLKGGDAEQTWALLVMANDSSSNETLLAAGTAGVMDVRGLKAHPIIEETAFSLASLSSYGETPVYAGLRSGLAILKRSGGNWRLAARAAGVTGEVRAIHPVEGGAWVAETGGRLLRVTEHGEITEDFGPSDGVPEGPAAIQEIGGELVVIASDGPYRVERGGREAQFTPILRDIVETVSGDISAGYNIRTDETDRVWVSGRDQVRAVVPTANGRWQDVTPPVLRRVRNTKGVSAEGGDGGVLWVATTDGLLRLAGDGAGRYATTVPARISRVETEGPVPIQDQSVTAPYGSPVRFRFSAAAFNDPDRTLYRTQLVGHDRDTSPWSREAFRDYTNLPPGDYAFRVEALTGQGVEARPATVAVHVPAPWHLTTWAALLAALLSGAAVAAVALAASQQQRRRADEQQARADELNRLNAELVHADEVKDLMLANASHELRTPLTAIIGFSEVLADNPDGEVSGLAAHMLSGGHRLLHTVNDLLDVARLRSGKVELSTTEADAADIARSVAAELRPLAVRKGLSLVVKADRSVPAVIDPAAFARVLTNLVSNAVKFTDRGCVAMAITAIGKDVVLDVTDTGCGMSPDFLPRLYETFEQESTGYRRAAEGSGLGMAITARLVELMGGEIEVSSALGEGTTFRVRIPGAQLTGIGDAVVARALHLPSGPAPGGSAQPGRAPGRPMEPSAPRLAGQNDGWAAIAAGEFWPAGTEE